MIANEEETKYELTRRLAATVAAAGMNEKLAKQFDKFFPPYRKKSGSSISQQAQDTLRKFREIEALNKVINGGGTKNTGSGRSK